jgi:hypothetical protein
MGAVLVALLSVLLVIGAGAQSAGAASINVTGPEEVVYDWSTMRCFETDFPDGMTGPFRDSLGRVQLTLGGANTRMIGPDLNNLTHDCTVVMPSNNNPLPWEYDDALFPAGTWTFDGQEVFRLVHTEYHGDTHPGYCQGQKVSCGFTTITFARSTDGGTSYTRPPTPGQLVAALPYHWVPSEGAVGYRAPSNIIEKDGYYYNMIMVSPAYKQQRSGVCLMRTQNLADPKSWRAWDGTGFNSRFVDPYRESSEPINRHVCEPVSPDELGQLNRSVTWNTRLSKYVATGTASRYDPAKGEIVRGFFYSLSDDLINWTPRQFLMEVENYASWVCGDPDVRAYPVLLDPDAPDRNLAVTDSQAYMYYMVHRRPNCVWTNDRDLVRVPVEFTP